MVFKLHGFGKWGLTFFDQFSLDPVQAQQFQVARLSADDTGKQRVKGALIILECLDTENFCYM